jgi:DNA-binding PadR family transcriptional regulator
MFVTLDVINAPRSVALGSSGTLSTGGGGRVLPAVRAASAGACAGAPLHIPAVADPSARLCYVAMSDDELTLFSYEILGLIGRTGAGPHDLRQMVHRGRILDWAGESQYYVEPKRLAKLGYLEAHKEPGKTRERTVYTLSDKGLQALRDYARTPVSFQPLKSEVLLRLMICDLVGEGPTRESVLTLREDVADLMQRLDETELGARALPHRRQYLLLVTDFLRRLLHLHLELVDEVERELAPGEAPVPERVGR